MDTRFLECFLAVTESGSVAEAARRLNIAPTTLALRIRTLEDELGFALMTRSGRTARPTPAGEAVALRAASILRELRDLRTLQDEEQPRGQLRLGVAQTAIATVLCDVLPALAQKYPQLEIAVQKGSSSHVFEKINAGELDGAFMFHPPFKLPKSFLWRPLRAEPYIVIASSSEPITEPLQLLRERPLVRYDRSLWSGQIAENYLRQQRIRPNDRIELDALDAIAVLVDRGIGVSLVPDRVLPWPGGLSIARHRLPDPAPERVLGLLWPQASAHARLIQAVEREAIPTLGGAEATNSAVLSAKKSWR
ncbi:DNA-binding transcriptional LysR family regulator [Rhizobium sp. ERR 922]|uniref:LysR family transcriptional regulator n=1 Tax=unclassified Rhizobium TaxID=2613769 RepID=UPI0011A01FB8|nr:MULTISPECIES: LysR family transcriptional regulator [unclassified Rhizobium]TWB46436.1 DNA-binding transcriptional LysR family regulator [Rhizobium sp. ERR 922]TWB88803.1 DNA-binding transcriptional LysR family regulator [Rhizobium sp. ERR 942]